MYRPNCPFCGSTQTRYSQQKSNLFQESHTCNNCGRQFSVTLSNPKKKRGFLSTLILALLGGAAIFIVIVFMFGRTSHQSSPSPTIEKQPSVADQELKPLSNETITPTQTVEPTPIPEPQLPKQEDFPTQAEQNAHAYTPTAEDYKRLEQEKQSQKSIADSQSQNDTLSIKTTLRNKSE
ncbi:hypothetical protein [Acinetobacter sp. HY1485]|uniref:hypothetical protein n=1 Tax=Acinetobacter sp. HY1485 TaxID=2970918 RepID=UPI0022B9CA6C|nr:hypothetical protein [Acinetobacter sp. HY1485]